MDILISIVVFLAVFEFLAWLTSSTSALVVIGGLVVAWYLFRRYLLALPEEDD